MGLIDRILRVIRANLNNLVAKTEDPEKILEQAVEEMQQDLIQMRQAVAGAIASQKRTERQVSQAEATGDEWYSRAQKALSQGDETLAREALTKRKIARETAKTLLPHLAQQNEVVTKLRKELRVLDSKLIEVKTKKDAYIARIRSAQASQKVYEILGNLQTETALERLEDKVMHLEAEDDAIASRRPLAIAQLTTSSIEDYALWEVEDDIDSQLAAMKANLQGASPSTKLPPNPSESSGHP
ncbi:MAG TPA: phage shock protein A [Cyanobacteria bacterium UBA11149]|nr:phage shock protein A [Cyanobacteria bacterium UBA11367]HBE59684.1 phage shock protein A [Cyanobacteria bacterium UBA11366]HBR75517.1 phage shock protein A [Cyanobacteria bacterium UBA11159]HBS71906.1 phage shock protein A [Cyanobacteria bacterium UBA11153]HBW89135.1 phage shock protein A [Cyanobacteria bacterium UBA11149]HCA95850.1 phage shock protein A [Cyanobacteria bacterium UBA9226]